MPQAPKETEDKTKLITGAWKQLAAAKSFAGMTLDDFNAKVKPTFDTRTRVTEAEAELTSAQDARDDADKVTNATIQLVVNSVKGDPAFGEDSDLYEAMGYVRKSERRSGLNRTNTPTPQPVPTN